MCPIPRTTSQPPMPEPGALPVHALEQFQVLAAHLGARPLLVFLDYDGTLCPLVSQPQNAHLAQPMREAIADLARVHLVGVVSGRALADVRERVGLDELYYAGNHGFELAGPEGAGLDRQIGNEYLADVAAVAAKLEKMLPPTEGVILEDKRYSLSVHYRLVAADEVPNIVTAVTAATAPHPRLVLRRGKCVLEILPRIEWHKGKAVRHLIGAAALRNGLPIFIGDDLTDEDAFRELRNDGIGIVVSEVPRPTAARYRVHDVEQVGELLHKLAGHAVRP